MSTRFIDSLIAFVAGLLLMASSAAATSLSVTYLGPASGYRSLLITGSPVEPIGGGALPDRVNAGAFSLQDPTIGMFVAWCLDITHWLGTSGAQPYKTTNTPFDSSYSLTGLSRSRLQTLFDANYFAGLENDRELSAGFQMAAWNLVYDTDFDLAGGVFRGRAYGGSDVTAFNHAQSFLTNASTYTGGRSWNLTYLESQNNHQNLVTVSAVPVPAAGLLMIGCLAGLGAVARRRKG